MEINHGVLLPEALMLGLPEVDAQHEGVFWRIERMKFDSIEQNGLPKARLDDLLDYLALHFRTEEALAEAAGLPFDNHFASHQHTLDMLRRWGDRVLAGELDVFGFLRYLEIWFERHILHEDLPFARELLASQQAKGG